MKHYTDWYAIKDSYDGFYGQDIYLITPKEYWLKHRHIPDGHANLDIPFLEEISDHTLVAKKNDNYLTTKCFLEMLGFEILDNPNWYYLDADYPEKLAREEVKSMTVGLNLTSAEFETKVKEYLNNL